MNCWAILLVGSSRLELVLLRNRIEWIAGSVGAQRADDCFTAHVWFSARITKPVDELAMARAKWRRDDGTRASRFAATTKWDN